MEVFRAVYSSSQHTWTWFRLTSSLGDSIIMFSVCLVIDGAAVLHACTGPHTVVVMARDLPRFPMRGMENTHTVSVARMHIWRYVQARASNQKHLCRWKTDPDATLCYVGRSENNVTTTWIFERAASLRLHVWLVAIESISCWKSHRSTELTHLFIDHNMSGHKLFKRQSDKSQSSDARGDNTITKGHKREVLFI